MIFLVSMSQNLSAGDVKSETKIGVAKILSMTFPSYGRPGMTEVHRTCFFNPDKRDEFGEMLEFSLKIYSN